MLYSVKNIYMVFVFLLALYNITVYIAIGNLIFVYYHKNYVGFLGELTKLLKNGCFWGWNRVFAPKKSCKNFWVVIE